MNSSQKLMSYDKFMALVWCRVRNNKERLGQAAFNTLATHYPHLTYKIRDTYLDPRHSLRIGAMCQALGIVNIPTAPINESIETPSIPLQVVETNNIIDIRTKKVIDLRNLETNESSNSSMDFSFDDDLFIM